jgi:hypothetical protein
LGLCNSEGAIDKREAIKWFTRGANFGIANAQKDLGYCYKTGDGVAVDIHIRICTDSCASLTNVLFITFWKRIN